MNLGVFTNLECSLDLLIDIDPQSKRTGKMGLTFGGRKVIVQNSRTRRFERDLAWEIKNKYPTLPKPLDGVLGAMFEFYIPCSDKRKHGTRNWKRPDCSNLVKSTEDACNGILWKDDGQISVLIAEKFYSERGRIRIRVWKL